MLFWLRFSCHSRGNAVWFPQLGGRVPAVQRRYVGGWGGAQVSAGEERNHG